MSAIGYIGQLLNGLSNDDDRVLLLQAFEYVMREGRIGDDSKAENFAWFAQESTTASVSGTEFSVVHGMESVPSRFIPSLKLDVVGEQLVPLRVSRAADTRRAYFTSTSTSAVFSGHFEVWIAAVGLAVLGLV